MSLIRKHVAVLQAWACLALVLLLFLTSRASLAVNSCSCLPRNSLRQRVEAK